MIVKQMGSSGRSKGGWSMASGKGTIMGGVGFGSALAMVISWSINKSVLFAIVHGILSWLYVIYYIVMY